MRPAISSLICAGGIAAALTVSACGGGGGDAGTDKDEFIAAADQICAEGDVAIEAKALELASASKGDVNAAAAETVIVPGLRRELQQLRELELPQTGRAQAEEFLDGFERGVDLLAADPEQLTAGPAASAFLKARRQAKQLGMVACARGAG